MTTAEFSVAFDMMWQNVMSDKAPGFNEFEKSFFLTQAQKYLCRAAYKGFGGSSFERTEFDRRSLDALVKDIEISAADSINNITPVSDNSVFFALPEDLWFIVYEEVEVSSDDCNDGKKIVVKPETHDEYDRLKSNPFRMAGERRALRLDCGRGIVEIISKYTVEKYHVRYLRLPAPIILEDLTGTTLSIDGRQEVTECELSENLHQRILDTAVDLAKQKFM